MSKRSLSFPLNGQLLLMNWSMTRDHLLELLPATAVHLLRTSSCQYKIKADPLKCSTYGLVGANVWSEPFVNYYIGVNLLSFEIHLIVSSERGNIRTSSHISPFMGLKFWYRCWGTALKYFFKKN